MPYTLKSFAPLSTERIVEIVDNTRPELVSAVAFMANQAKSNPEYVALITGYQSSADKKSYIETHQQKMAEFLNDCGLMGYGHERGELRHDNYVIGSEGMELILAYLKDKKSPNQRLHEIVSVKNEDLVAPDGSMKHSNIFLQNNQIHSSLKRHIIEDIDKAKQQGVDLEKTYQIEAFGTTGGNHGMCLTIRKKVDEEAPLVHFFDPSSALIRNGLEATQNSIACGWNSQIIVAATVKKAFEERGLKFVSDKYFNSSEPQQHRGYVYCGTIGYEAANRLASMTREQHEELLQSYVYQSPFGGRTEVGSRKAEGEIESINIDRVRAEGGYVKNPVFGLRSDEVLLSQFVEPALSSRVEELNTIPHQRKEGRPVESEADHIRRYQPQEGERLGYNTMLEEKALRQKIGHLFEIVSSDYFLSKAGEVGLVPNPFFEATPYFPKGNSHEVPQVSGAEGVIGAINSSLPNTNKINRASFDGNNCRISIYLGDVTGEKVVDFFAQNGVEAAISRNDFSHNLPADVDHSFTHVNEYTFQIPRQRFDKIITTIQGKQFCKPDKDDLFYPKPNAKILGTEVAQLSQEQLKRF
ncbi:hypothetical protein FJ366_04240 [Candidatus Dependentiae bacterium]|nr:hypothetical protein [Candidatus Dependentiae bacterium]